MDNEVNNSNEIIEDLSNVKIRTVLSHKLKKMSPSAKKIIPFFIVGILSFGLGMGADRAFTTDKHKNSNYSQNLQNFRSRFQSNNPQYYNSEDSENNNNNSSKGNNQNGFPSRRNNNQNSQNNSQTPKGGADNNNSSSGN